MKKTSKNGARGQGSATAGPPPSTIGSSSLRSAASNGTPARSSISSTFVYVSSCGSVNPQRSHSRTGRDSSRVHRGTRDARMSAAMSGQGQ